MPSQISKKIAELDDNDLRSKIRRGRAWLIVHSQDTVKRIGESYDPERWDKNLNLYEMLVDQAEERGFSETDCWSFDVDNLSKQNLTTEERYLKLKGDKYLTNKA